MKIRQNIAISETGFVFDPTTGESFSVNIQGIEIINLLKQGKSKDDIQKVMLKQYDVDAITFEKTYYDFISMLKQYNLLENDEKQQ